MKIMNSIKALAGKIQSSFVEGYTFFLIVIGLSTVAYIYLDWKAALTTFIVTQAVILTLALRNAN